MLRIGKIERGRGGRTKAVFDEGIEVIGAERDSFEKHDGNPGKNGPEKRSAARPAGHEQHPGVGRDVPEGQNNDPVEKEHDVQEIVSLNQGGGRTHSMNQQDDAADQKDHQVGKDNYSERD